MTRVLLLPEVRTVKPNNGIGRVLHAQLRHLPAHGIEFVAGEDQADVVAGHTHDYGARRIEVCHLHGLYWTGDKGSGSYSTWHQQANTRIIATARRARALTVPSEWVAEPFRRDMRVRPRVIGHGIDLAEWAPGEDRGYVLWNKNRRSDVCSPLPAWELARRGVRVWATFEPENKARPETLKVIGEQPADAMRETIRNAHIYLATTKETFGIGTLEALACGVPVLGFKHGGTADIVQHKITGYLARSDDWDDLYAGWEYVRGHHAELSQAARAAAERYDWPLVIGQYAALYHELASAPPEPTGVCVVITNHNYGHWLGQCIESVLAQTYRVDEIIVVDDGSTDQSRDVAAQYAERGVRLVAQPNQGVAAARNHGVALTAQPFVVCLDADDYLDPRYIAACRGALLADRGHGLAWTGMSVVRPGLRPTGNVWPGPFNWEWQAAASVPPHTTIPTGAMFRRAMWERAGGYRQQYAPGEDAEFYTRGLSVGFTAVKATELPLYFYREHGRGAHSTRAYVPIDDYAPWMRDGEYPLAAPAETVPSVRSYSEPKVSVIIPVGPGHAKYLPDALESLIGQSMREWECVVVNDSAEVLPIDRYPFVKRAHWVYVGAGAGAARNAGLNAAQAPLVCFLDADDQLAPGALAHLCRAFAQASAGYVYGDWQYMGEAGVHETVEFDPAALLAGDRFGSMVLMAADDARAVRFDEALPALEDWEFFLRAATLGIHGQRAPGVAYRVRRTAAGRTNGQPGVHAEAARAIAERYRGKELEMAKSCCGGNKIASLAASLAADGVPPERALGLSIRRTTVGRGSSPVVEGVTNVVRMEFIGQRTGAVTYNGQPGSGRQYRGGNNPVNRFANVHPDDVEILERSSQWRRVAPPLVEPVTLPESKPEPAAKAVSGPAAAHPVGASEALETPAPASVPGPIGPAPEPAAPPTQVMETASGIVKRKRGTAKKPKGGQSELKDLPPLDSK